ncbi:hypothetical protein LSTR_LSTR009911 [Laodelphax striatellus]|uniref:Uncharacterized protein n=1 Tax=Laodelphax striatellus TaxID=195883 RepID=A0A482WK32_LAOST|nr:hypothetical protein LSTR_LSTR009911 [Laodelphax striatellus]
MSFECLSIPSAQLMTNLGVALDIEAVASAVYDRDCPMIGSICNEANVGWLCVAAYSRSRRRTVVCMTSCD